MGRWVETWLVAIALSAVSATALAQDDPAPEVSEDAEPKKPGRGDFDAGGQARLPSGPDEMGEFATFNWVGFDLVGRYFLLDSVTVNGTIPLAIITPDMFNGEDPSWIGGVNVSLDAMLPTEFGTGIKTRLGLTLRGAYMREGAMLLSPRDFPAYTGSFQPGLGAGVITDIKLSSLLSLATTPLFIYQSGDTEAITAIQVPLSTVVKLGSLLKVSADLGVYTGDDFSLSGDDGGRLSAGGSLTVKLGPILVHAGAGAASLLTGGFYPEIGDSIYIDLNVKYAK